MCACAASRPIRPQTSHPEQDLSGLLHRGHREQAALPQQRPRWRCGSTPLSSRSIPRRSYDLKLLRVRVPVELQPEHPLVYSGVWDGTFKVAWTDNPAWCFYDLVTSTRYGLGQLSSPSPRSTSGRCTGWPVTATNWFPTDWVGSSRASPATCTCKPASRPTRWCRTWPRSFGAWPTGLAAQSRSRRMRPQDPVYQFTASQRHRWRVCLPGIVGQGPAHRGLGQLGRSGGFLPPEGGIRRGRRRHRPLRRGAEPMWWPWDAPHGARPTGWASGCLYSEQSESEIITFRTGLEGAVVRPGRCHQGCRPQPGWHATWGTHRSGNHQ